jgi:hypothetical protein
VRATVRVEGERRLMAELEKLRRGLGLKGGEYADYAARAMRDGVLRNVQPFGTGKKAQELGKRAVRGDLMKCFRVVRDADGRRKGVISGESEAKVWHQSRRGGNGRVRSGKRRAITASTFGSYLETVQARVGMAKASMAGGDDVRLKSRIPRWLRPWVKTGDARRQGKTAGAVWTFSGTPPAVGSDRVMGTRGVRRVMAKQGRIVLGALRRDMRRSLKRAERRVNRG